MSEETEPMILTEDLTKVYVNGTEVRALNGVSLKVKKGSLVAVIGPSGSGKSTLLNIVGTLDVPSTGRVVVDGVQMHTLSGNAMADFRREKIGFVFQLFNLVPTLTTLENVMLPLIPYRRRLTFKLEDRARELLAAVGVGHRLDHLPGQLSGGEQQRAAIARALINDPAVILADEPTGNVDTRAGDEVMELLRQARDERGRTVVVVTHSPRVAAFAEHVYFLKDGAIVDQGQLVGEADLEAVWRRFAMG